MIVYTVLNRKTFDDIIYLHYVVLHDPNIKISGKRSNYRGMLIFPSIEEADLFLSSDNFMKYNWGYGDLSKLRSKDFSIYSLEIKDNLEDDTYHDNGYLHLLNDAKLLKKIK
jgi:hypothetical protein